LQSSLERSDAAPAAGTPAVERLLAQARARLRRLAPGEAAAALADGGVLIDIRPSMQRERDGRIPDAVVICRNVLEWRCDPSSPWRDRRVSDPSRRLLVLCNEGCQSSLVAATLQDLGHADATDVVGGFQAWRAAGLPVL
jgi:rhodanese-related sulfurtransferase